jgi:hypothetical protein
MSEDRFRLLATSEISSFKSRTPILERLLSYWNKKRAGRLAPTRADIDPVEIKKLLSHIMIVDLTTDPFRVRYRLVGTEITKVSHFDFTGHFLDQLSFESGDTMDWTDCYRQVAQSGLPGFGVVHWRTGDISRRWIEFLICPLSNDGITITQCIAAEDYEPLSPMELDRLDRTKPQA